MCSCFFFSFLFHPQKIQSNPHMLTRTCRFLLSSTYLLFLLLFFFLSHEFPAKIWHWFNTFFWHASQPPLLLNSHFNRREAFNSLSTIIFHTITCEIIHKWSCLKFNKPLIVLVLFSPPVCFISQLPEYLIAFFSLFPFFSSKLFFFFLM